MTPQEQERLFKRVRRHFPSWVKRKCSGYIHGISDHDRDLPPSPDIVKRYTDKGDIDAYAMGYLYGYADALGLDAQVEPWSISPSMVIEYRWWEK